MNKEEKWKLKHQMIVQSIKDKGNFDLDEINRTIKDKEEQTNAE